MLSVYFVSIYSDTLSHLTFFTLCFIQWAIVPHTSCSFHLTGPAVEVGVTMLLTSISTVSEVKMVSILLRTHVQCITDAITLSRESSLSSSRLRRLQCLLFFSSSFSPYTRVHWWGDEMIPPTLPLHNSTEWDESEWWVIVEGTISSIS